MSDIGLLFKLQDKQSSNQKLSAFYDFTFDSSDEANVQGDGSSSTYTGVQVNSTFANDTSLHTGFLLGSIDSSEASSLIKASGILQGNKLNLTSGNFQVPFDGLNANDISVLIDFEFADGDFDDGIIMGCFKTGEETINSLNIETSEGFNIGVTDRGHLFCQTFGPNGDAINIAHSIELSKRNLISVSTTDTFITLSFFDYFNDLVRSLELPVDRNYISSTSVLNFGGSDTYFRSTDNETATFSGSLNSLAIFSGYIEEEFLKDLGEGMLGSYSFTAGSTVTEQRLTGYADTISYKTGITGYDYISTGTLEIITGREEFTGSTSPASPDSKKEGERYYKYYTLNNGNVKTFYKEELGQLHSDSGYIYYPTGEGAFDTLGLNDISESIDAYTELTGMTQDKITIDLFGKTPLTGTLSEVSGVVQTALEETYSIYIPSSSGVTLEEDSEDFKKNFIYYMGGRS